MYSSNSSGSSSEQPWEAIGIKIHGVIGGGVFFPWNSVCYKIKKINIPFVFQKNKVTN